MMRHRCDRRRGHRRSDRAHPGDGGSALVRLDKANHSPHQSAKSTSGVGDALAGPEDVGPRLVDWSRYEAADQRDEDNAVYDTPGVTVKAVEGLAGLELDQEADRGRCGTHQRIRPLIDALVEQRARGRGARHHGARRPTTSAE